VALRDDGQLDTTLDNPATPRWMTASAAARAAKRRSRRPVVDWSWEACQRQGVPGTLLQNGAQDSGFKAPGVSENMTRATALVGAVDGSMLVAGEARSAMSVPS
jgi:hypothetical protein